MPAHVEPEAFFVGEGAGRWRPTDWTRGPWDPNAQHAGPPAALLARAIESLDPGSEMQVARFTMEVLRPVPLVPLQVRADVIRPGRRVQLAGATLSDPQGGVEIARATAWRIRRDGGGIPETNLEPLAMPGPEACEPIVPFDPWGGPSYFSAIEWRFARGGFLGRGPSAAWMRMRVPLVEGEEPSPLGRVLVAADSGNGLSMELPIDRFLFINLELSVHLVRMPAGRWVCLDAITRLGPEGAGLAQTTLWDERGRIGSGNQSLLVAPR